MSQFIKGQRWLSETEPELGLALVVQAEPSRVQVVFPASGETRTYAADNAPPKRVRFRVGDTVKSQDGKELTIREVLEQHGLLTYAGDQHQILETELSDS